MDYITTMNAEPSDAVRTDIELLHQDMAEYEYKLQNGLPLIAGTPTGFSTLDNSTQGLLPSKIFTIAGLTGVGKSFAAAQIAISAARQGKPVLFYSIGMERDSMENRWLSYLSGVNLTKITEGTYRKDVNEFDKVKAAARELGTLPIRLDTTSDVSVDYICNTAIRKSASQKGLGVIIIDCLHSVYITNENGYHDYDSYMIGRKLKSLAKQLDVPIVVVACTRPQQCQIDNCFEELFQLSSAVVEITETESPELDEFVVVKNHFGYTGARIPVKPRFDIARFTESA